MIIGFLRDFWHQLQALGQWIIDGIFTAFGFLFAQILEILFSAIVALVNTLDFSVVLTNQFADWSNLPGGLTYVINATGIPQGITILLSAILIRMTINLIPGSITRV